MEEEKVLAPELEEGDVNNKQEEETSIADSVKIVSPGRLVAKRFFRSRLSVVGLVTLIVLFLFAFAGPLFSPWGQSETDFDTPTEKRNTYTQRIYQERISVWELFTDGKIPDRSKKETKQDKWTDKVIDYNGETGFGTYKPEGATEPINFLVTTGSSKAIYICDAQGNIIQYSATEYEWDKKTFNSYGKIDANHWLGTDENGQDVFTRLMYGGRISLTLGFVVIFLEVFLGVILGGLAGYFGKWVDQLIMRIVDIFACVPTFPILLIMSAVLDGFPDLDPMYKIYYMMLTLTLLGWSGIARVVRGQILFLREQEYMIAAEALGLSVPRKIFRHLLPNILPQLIVQMTLGLGGIILTESTLSYLGIGVPVGQASWGTMISSAQKTEVLQNYPNIWIPAGILIVLAVLSFNFIGDGLRDAFDPKASR